MISRCYIHLMHTFMYVYAKDNGVGVHTHTAHRFMHGRIVSKPKARINSHNNSLFRFCPYAVMIYGNNDIVHNGERANVLWIRHCFNWNMKSVTYQFNTNRTMAHVVFPSLSALPFLRWIRRTQKNAHCATYHSLGWVAFVNHFTWLFVVVRCLERLQRDSRKVKSLNYNSNDLRLWKWNSQGNVMIPSFAYISGHNNNAYVPYALLPVLLERLSLWTS